MIHKADSCVSDSRYSSGGGSRSCKASAGWKQNVGKVFSFFFSFSGNVKSKGLHCSFLVNTRRDVGKTKIQFSPVFFLQKEVASDT